MASKYLHAKRLAGARVVVGVVVGGGADDDSAAVGTGGGGSGGLSKRVLDLSSHGHERLLNVSGSLGRGLNVGDAEAVSEGLGGLVLDVAAVDEVALVADEELAHVLRGVAVDLREPHLDVVERIEDGDVVNDDDAVGAAVVSRGDGAEAVLASSVPGVGQENKRKKTKRQEKE